MNEVLIEERCNFDDIEAQCLELDQIDCPVTHIFYDGIYIRECFMPAGTIVIGHDHKFEQSNIFIKGKMEVLINGESKIIEAPMTFKGPPGRKIARIIEDCVWQNAYFTTERDIDVLEELLYNLSNAYRESKFSKYLENFTKAEQDRIDFKKAIEELGYTEDQVWTLSDNENDQIELPIGAYNIKIGTSAIAGRGVISTAPIFEHQNLGLARIGEFRTPIGRYTNHSANPNAKMEQSDDKYYLVAIKDIKMDQEVTIDYRQVIKLLRG